MNSNTNCVTLHFNPEDYVSVSEAARLLNRDKSRVYRWIQNEKMIALQIAGYLCVPKSEVTRLIEKSCLNCKQRTGQYCMCRAAEDMLSPCPDWYNDFTK